MKRRKPINKREANSIAVKHIGNRGADGFLVPCKQIVELKSVGGLEVHGQHPSSWRKAFHDAGVFDV